MTRGVNRLLAPFAALAVLLVAPVAARAQDAVTFSIVLLEDAAEPGGERFVAPGYGAPTLAAIARFGPFRVLDPSRAALVDVTDSASPADFARMLQAYPGLRVLEMIECPGTSDDVANLRLGRMIRRAGLDTSVPAAGSVRSGAVELFLAGRRRRAAADAEFAVHSWQDADGYQAADFPADDPVHLAYLAYYREMGLNEAQASAFYAMTNAVPHDAARWLSARELAAYAPLD